MINHRIQLLKGIFKCIDLVSSDLMDYVNICSFPLTSDLAAVWDFLLEEEENFIHEQSVSTKSFHVANK